MIADVNSKMMAVSADKPPNPLDEGSNLLFNRVAMEIREVRRRNLEGLLKNYESLASLARATGTDARVLSQIKNEDRNMGARVARRFEDRLDKQRGWMDALQFDEVDGGNEELKLAIKLARDLPAADLQNWLRMGRALLASPVTDSEPTSRDNGNRQR